MLKKQSIPAKLTWERQYKGTTATGGETHDIRTYPEGIHPVYVHYGRSETLNLGNYESTKVTFSVTVPCVQEELNEATDYAIKFVERRLIAEIRSLEEDLMD